MINMILYNFSAESGKGISRVHPETEKTKNPIKLVYSEQSRRINLVQIYHINFQYP